MCRFTIARACRASALFTGVLLSGLGPAHAAGFDPDASTLARALLAQPIVSHRQVAASAPAPLPDAQESARRLLDGSHPAAANRSAPAISVSSSDDDSMADASDLARRMIAGKGG